MFLRDNNKLVDEVDLEKDDQLQQFVYKHSSIQTVGTTAGHWCSYGSEEDVPGDQQVEDRNCLLFDTRPLDNTVEILGSPYITLTIQSDKPKAFVVARLCDVFPDGSSTLVTFGALNLCHMQGHDKPQLLKPGASYTVTFTLKDTAQANAVAFSRASHTDSGNRRINTCRTSNFLLGRRRYRG
jgi:predicted acyl esterase